MDDQRDGRAGSAFRRLTIPVVDGIATGVSDRLPAGSYTICLDPVLTRADGATLRVLDAEVCEAVTLEPAPTGEPTTVDVSFRAVVTGRPTISPPPDDPRKPGPPLWVPGPPPWAQGR